MRALDENIKGFNLIELLVVVILIGVVSAIGYPNFNNWRSERETKDSVIKIKSLIDGINAQVQRGRYAFVQVHILDNKKEIIVTSRGMKPEKLASLMKIVAGMTPIQKNLIMQIYVMYRVTHIGMMIQIKVLTILRYGRLL